MSNYEMTTNAEEVMKQFADLNIKEMRKATKAALRRGAFILARQTKRNLKSVLPKATHRGEKYNDRLIDGVKYRIYKKGNSGKVHILGTSKKGSGTYRLRFFEVGTKMRKHKKTGKNVGQIKAYNFFSNARATSKQDVYDAIDERLMETIKKINEKKINGK